MILAYFLVFLSGLCALIYEIVWMRVFIPVFGVSVYSTTTVLCAFMGGLGLGSFLAPHLIKKWKYSLWMLYTLLNLCIGISAAAVVHSTDYITSAYVFISGLNSFNGLDAVIRFMLSFAVVAVPTTLMGLSFPVLIQASRLRWPKDNSGTSVRRIGWFYGLNTLGGAIGCLLAGFFLIYKFGLKSTTMIAASINLLLALTALFFSAGTGILTKTLGTDKGPRGPFLISPNTLIFLYAVIGMTSLSYELIWARILTFYLQSSTYSFSIMLMVFLTGIGSGSLFFSSYLDNASKPKSPYWAIRTAGLIQLLLAISAVGSVHLYARLGEIWTWIINSVGAGSWEAIVFQKFFITGLIIFPTTFFMGIMFPLMAKLYKTHGATDSKTVGYLYAANTFGAIIGLLVAGFILFNKIGVQKTLLIVSALNSVIGIAFLARRQNLPFKLRLSAPGLVLIYIALCILMPGRMFAYNYEKYFGNVLFYKESAADTAIVVSDRNKKGRLFLVFHDGRGTSSTMAHTNYGNRMFAYSCMAVNPDARDVLVIGMGAGNTASAFSKFPITSLDIVDISPGCFEAAEYFYTNEGVLNDPRVHTYVEDGRNFLLKSKRLYDVIQLEPPSLHTDGVVTLYTKEFYEIAQSKLKDGGILGQWIDEDQCGKEVSYILINTMMDVFNNSTLWNHWPGYDNLIIGRKSDEDIWIDYERAKRLFSRQEVLQDLKRVDSSLEDVLSNLIFSKTMLRQMVKNSQKITDDSTIVDFYIPRLKRAIAFGGGMAYAWSPLKGVFSRNWLKNKSKILGKATVFTYPHEYENPADLSLERIVDGIPNDVLEEIRILRKPKSRNLHFLKFCTLDKYYK